MQRLTEIEIVWISAFNDALSKKVKSLKDGEDICQKQTLNVLRQIKKYIERYPNPQDAARVMSFTARINYGRDEAMQRGEGSRKGRFVGQFPTHKTDSGETVEVDLEDLQAVNPETQAVERDLCRQAIKEIKPIAATGFALTAICGYDQGSAAAIAGVTRPHISRQMKQAEHEMQSNQQDAA